MKSFNQIWRNAILAPDATIEDAIRNLNEVSIKIVLVVNSLGVLEGTITDGDIRRGFLNGFSFKSPINSIIHRAPLVAPIGMAREQVIKLMVTNKIQQIPIVDEQHHIVDLYLWDEVSAPTIRQNLMVIMAGGMGTRLRPHTENCPKPLLHVAGKPMLEHIIEQAKLDGFQNFVIAIHYLGHMIESYFGDGKKLGVNIQYLREEKPLGTVGALSLMIPPPTTPFVVTNGDVITDIRYGELLDFHLRHGAAATMAVRMHELRHPFGVVQMEGIEIVGFEEKPTYRTYINAGAYALNPESLSELNANEGCDMPTLFENLKLKNHSTIAYPMHEPWLDIGRPEDLITAQMNFLGNVE